MMFTVLKNGTANILDPAVMYSCASTRPISFWQLRDLYTEQFRVLTGQGEVVGVNLKQRLRGSGFTYSETSKIMALVNEGTIQSKNRSISLDFRADSKGWDMSHRIGPGPGSIIFVEFDGSGGQNGIAGWMKGIANCWYSLASAVQLLKERHFLRLYDTWVGGPSVKLNRYWGIEIFWAESMKRGQDAFEHSIFTIDNGHLKLQWHGRKPVDEREQVVEARPHCRSRPTETKQILVLYMRSLTILLSAPIPQFVFPLGPRIKQHLQPEW